MIKIYVQELATYNNAISVGRWIEVSEFDSELESLFEEATEALKEHGYYYGVDTEEYEIVDWECAVDIDLSSYYENIETLKRVNELLSDLDSNEIDKLGFLIDEGYSISDINSDTIESVYSYQNWDDAIEEFVELFLELSGVERVYNYLDFSKIQRDLEICKYALTWTDARMRTWTRKY